MIAVAFVIVALAVWAIVASAAAVEAQDRCNEAEEREDRLLRDLYGDDWLAAANHTARLDVERIWREGGESE